MRVVAGSISGILAGVFLCGATTAGIEFNYEFEEGVEYWGVLFWGDHYVIRCLWSVLTTGVAAT